MLLLDIHEPGQTPAPHSGASVGIDLGTTNSLVAISNKGLQEVIAAEGESALLPSVVLYENDEVIVGDAALESPFAIRSIKRLMGRGEKDAKKLVNRYPYNIEASPEIEMACLNINGRKVSPVEVSAEILKALKKRAEDALENKVDKAVITVPAYFDDAARAATKHAAQLAGLEVLRLVNEPTAAALAYGLDNASEGIYAVYDLGGGTFDISILKMEKGVFQVLATGGDTALGGDDFDHAVAEHFAEEFFKGMKLNDHDMRELVSVGKKAKEFLTENDSGIWKVNVSKKEFEVALDRDGLNFLIKTFVDKTIRTCAAVVSDSGVDTKEIKGVVMVGGSTRVPLVRAEVKKLFGKEPLINVDPDKVVALGAAIQAEALTQGSDTLLLDVTPLSLGLETMGGMVEKIIERNTPIPATRSQKFTTYQDGQTGMKIHVVQGEREMVDDCRSLARFELTGIPPMTAGIPVIEVTFTIDADGLLTVSAREEKTGIEQKIEVKPTYGLPPEKIEEMLLESMKNARQDITKRLLEESRLEARIFVRAVESALKTDADLLDKNSLEKINKQVLLVKELIDGVDRDAIDYEIKELEKICGEFAEKRLNRALSGELEGKKIDEIEKKVNKA